MAPHDKKQAKTDEALADERTDKPSGTTVSDSGKTEKPLGGAFASSNPNADEPIGDSEQDAEIADIPLTAELSKDELPALGPKNPDPLTAEEAEARSTFQRIDDRSPEALQKAGVSPADLEMPTAAAGGPAIIVKQNPETPSPHMVGASLGAVPGPVEVQLLDADGNDISGALGVGDRAQMSSRALAAQTNHPANQIPGWSNPNLRDATDEEREADAAAYAERFGG